MVEELLSYWYYRGNNYHLFPCVVDDTGCLHSLDPIQTIQLVVL